MLKNACNEASAEMFGRGQELDKYQLDAEAHSHALKTANAWNRHCFKAAFVEAEVVKDDLMYAISEVGKKRKRADDSEAARQHERGQVAGLTKLNCHTPPDSPGPRQDYKRQRKADFVNFFGNAMLEVADPAAQVQVPVQPDAVMVDD